MIIKKISTVNLFGCYQNFNWDINTPEFCQYNFIYGWNYSGKTTLSRILRCLETKEKHKHFPEAEYKLETDISDISHRDIGTDFPIRVFNEEYVEDNFKWNDENHSIEPVIILGKEAKELEEKAIKLNKTRIEKEDLLKDIKNKKQARERELQTHLTNKASEIRNTLNITNPREFDKNVLLQKVNEIKNDGTKILPDQVYQHLLTSLRDTTEYKVMNSLVIDFNVKEFIEKAKSILEKKVSVQQVIEKLKDNPKLSNWVRDGIPLHKDKETKCQFCGNELPTDLFERLEKHFSQEFNEFINEIDSKITEVTEQKYYIEKIKFPDKAHLIKSCQSQYEEALERLIEELSKSKQILIALIKELNDKKSKPFDELKLVEITDNDEKIESLLNSVNSIITIHNEKIENIAREIEETKKKIIIQQIAKFIVENKYFAFIRLFQLYSSHIKKLENEIKFVESEIETINKQIIAAAIGAEKINEYLKRFFNSDRLQIQLTSNGKFKLFRDKCIAKNLSNGERNIISLIYFFAKLEETNFNLSNSIIFIDDPVSSLDSNHIFGIYSFLSEKLKNCGQLFITTHNFDFFNLLKDFRRYDLSNQGNLYLVKRTSTTHLISPLPAVLEKHKSEYNYLFSILFNFNASSDKNNFELLYFLPNIVRRFLELYLFVKYPDGKKFTKKLEKFFLTIDDVGKKELLKLIDEYSHEENPEHSHKFPDIQEIEPAIKFLMETISQKDGEHFNALCESITN